MELTKAEKLLIGYLKVSGVSKGMAAAIYMTARRNALEMCKYMSEHPEKTEDELLDAARRIAAK